MEIIEQLISAIKDFLFGKAVRGERPQEPSFRSVYPKGYSGCDANFSVWFNEVNFGKRVMNRSFLW